MQEVLVQGFMLGLISGPLCAGTCAPVFLSFALAREESGLARQGRALGEFLGGRLVGYVAVGLVCGWAGAHLAEGMGMPRVLVMVTQGALGLALLLYAGSKGRQSSWFCKLVRKQGVEGRYPLVLGLLSGLAICPPFVLAVERVVEVGGAVAGAVFFMAFFVATSLALLPLLFVSLANLLTPVRSLARVGCAVVALVCLCRAAAIAGEMTGLNRSARAEVAVVAPKMEVVEKVAPVPHRVVMEGGEPIGLIVLSKDLAPEALGCNGHVPVAVTMDFTGKITKVELLPGHVETPGFYEKVQGSDLLMRLAGKDVSEAIEVGKDVDAVSGATCTSAGVVDATRVAARRAARELFPLYQREPVWFEFEGTVAGGVFRFNPWHLGVFVLLALAIFSERRRIIWMRYVLLCVSLLFMGVWLKVFFSVGQVAEVVAGGAVSWPMRADWYIMILCSLCVAVVAGRTYCAYLCPFGVIQEFVGLIFRNPIRIKMKWDLRLRRVKYYVLVVLLMLYAATRSGKVLLVEPFGDMFSLGFVNAGSGAVTRAGWLVFLLIGAALVKRFYCRFLCPAGAAMGFLTQHRLMSEKRFDGCVGCGDCLVSCAKSGGGR